MDNPTTNWDRPVTNKELDQHYGKESAVSEEIFETLTKTIRTVDHKKLGVPYVQHKTAVTIEMYSIEDVVKDYTAEKLPLQALMAVLAGSDCTLVAKYREALAEAYADSWADYVTEMRG